MKGDYGIHAIYFYVSDDVGGVSLVVSLDIMSKLGAFFMGMGVAFFIAFILAMLSPPKSFINVAFKLNRE